MATNPLPPPKLKAKASSGLLSNLALGPDKDFFVENLALMLDSGMTLTEAFEVIKNGSGSRRFKVVVGGMQDDIAAGLHLWQAFQRARLLPEYTLSLIRIGEESGRLAENLKVIAKQQSKDRVFASRVRSAMLYPAIVVGLTLVIGAGIAWFILPRLATVFLNLRIDLPALTRMLITAGKFLQVYGYFAVPLFFAAFLGLLYFIFFFKKTKFLGQKILFNLPGIRALVMDVELSRFGYILGTLLSAGVPLVEAVKLLEQAAIFHQYKKFYGFLKSSLEEGNSFKITFQKFPKARRLVPVYLQGMIVASERSGRLEQACFGFAATFEEKSEAGAKNLTVLLEPMLLLVVWLGVLFIALAVILPLYQLLGGLSSTPGQVQRPASGQNKILPKAVPLRPASTTPAGLRPGPAKELAAQVALKRLKIASPDVGYARVRAKPSLLGEIIGRAKHLEIFEFTKQVSGWYEIIFTQNKTGWISSRYTQELP